MDRVSIPGLRETLTRAMRESALDINCVAVATVQAFNATNQTVTATLNYVRVVRDNQGNETLVKYQPLIQCPVMILQGGQGGMTMPIAKDDPCIILFADRDIDNWIQYGTLNGAPNSMRLHDMNDAIAICGINPLSRSIASYLTDGVKIFNGTSFITIRNKISLSVGGNKLVTALNNLCTALTSWIDTHGDGPNPATVTAINNVKTLIDGILE